MNDEQLHARMIKGSRIRVQVSYPGGQPAPPPPAPEGYKPSMEATEASSTIKEEEEPAPVTVEALFGNRASVLCTALGQGERARRVRVWVHVQALLSRESVCVCGCNFEWSCTVHITHAFLTINRRCVCVRGRLWTSRARTGT